MSKRLVHNLKKLTPKEKTEAEQTPKNNLDIEARGDPDSLKAATRKFKSVNCKDMGVICLVTCYSESQSSAKASLDSISLTRYSSSRKLAFVVCDGIVTGARNRHPTAEHELRLVDTHSDSRNPVPMPYISLDECSKQINRAVVVSC